MDETFFGGRKLLNPLHIPSGRGLDSPGRGEPMVPAFLALTTLQPMAPSHCSVGVAIDARRVSVRSSLFRAGSVVGGLGARKGISLDISAVFLLRPHNPH